MEYSVAKKWIFSCKRVSDAWTFKNSPEIGPDVFLATSRVQVIKALTRRGSTGGAGGNNSSNESFIPYRCVYGLPPSV